MNISINSDFDNNIADLERRVRDIIREFINETDGVDAARVEISLQVRVKEPIVVTIVGSQVHVPTTDVGVK